jgi:hypothetical protein
LLVFGRIAIIERIVDHDRVSTVKRQGLLFSCQDFQKQLEFHVCLLISIQKAATNVQQIAKHFDVVVFEIGEQTFQAIDCVRFGKHLKFD